MRLAGPMQSWGHDSRYSHRSTAPEPTKSGVLGMLAAAQGRRRSDPVADLVDLRFGVRSDQPGRLLEDFQTAHSSKTGRAMPLTTRQYLADAVFVAGVEGDSAFLEELNRALHSPQYALFLGRRAFAPSGSLSLGIVDDTLQGALRSYPWVASDWFRRRQRQRPFMAPVSVDSRGWENSLDRDSHRVHEDRVQDVPVSWDIRHRQYAWRPVRRYWVPLGENDTNASRDWLEALG